MSFGASPSDIIIVVTFARRLYRQCKNAGEEYLDISREVRGLHTVLRHLKYEVEAPDSILNRERSLYSRELAPVIGHCDYTLRELDELLQKYDRLSNDRGSAGARLRDRIRFGSAEMDQLGSVRMKLINHKTTITVFLDTIQLRETSRMSATLDNHGGQLDMILDKVDRIAAKLGQGAGSMMTSYDDDDKEVWKQFRRELVAEGFSSDVLQQHKDVLRAYIRQIDQNGLLDEMPLDPQAQSPTAASTMRWVSSVNPSESNNVPPPFESLRTNSDDSVKEMVLNEDNLKFPQSIKSERGRSDSSPTEKDSSRQLVLSPEGRDPGPKEGIGDIKSPLPTRSPPRLITSTSIDTKSAGDGGPPKAVPRSPMSEPVICTTELILADGYALDDRYGMLTSSSSDPQSIYPSQGEREMAQTPSGSPLVARNQSSFTDDNISRSLSYRPKNQQLAPEQAQYGTSPRASGALSIPQNIPLSPSTDRYGVSPRQTTSFLAPDQQGRRIPLDAKWTRIRRSLVSTEILDQDKLRYEARPDFVAVLGVLTRDQVSEMAARTTALREARRNRNQAQVQQTQSPRPPQSQQPSSKPQPQRRVKFRRGNSRSDEDERKSSEGSESSDDRKRERGREKPRDRRPLESRSYLPNEYQYNQPYGIPIPSGPAFSQGPMSPPYVSGSPHSYSGTPQVWIPVQPAPNPGYFPPEEPRRRHSDGEKNRSKSSGNEKKSRWRDNLTAAGLGGAAASIFSVLSEAAAEL